MIIIVIQMLLSRYPIYYVLVSHNPFQFNNLYPMLLQRRYKGSPYAPTSASKKSPMKNIIPQTTLKTPKLENKKQVRVLGKSPKLKGVKLPDVLPLFLHLRIPSEEVFGGVQIQQITICQDQKDHIVKLCYLIQQGYCAVCREFAVQYITRKRIQLYRAVGSNSYIVQLLGSHPKDNHKQQNIITVITQRVVSGSLFSILENFKQVPLMGIKKFIQDLLNGLAHIHSKNVIHRDIRSKTLLIDGQGNLKIGGWFKKCEIQGTKLSGINKIEHLTPYTPPQCILINQFQLNDSYDIWSVGCLLIQLCSGYSLSLTPKITLKQRKQELMDYSFYSKILINYPPELKAIVTKCLDKNPSNRLKAVDLLKMSFFSGHSSQ